MDAAKRINKILIELRISPYKLAEELNYKTADSVYNIQKGKYGISRSFAIRMQSAFPQFNYDWVLTGEGEMFNKSGNTNISNKQSGSKNYNLQTESGKAIVNEPGSLEALKTEVGYLKDIIIQKDKEIELLRRLLNGSPGNE